MIIEIKSFQTNGIVSLVEFKSNNANSIEYISGSNAIDKNFIEVREISQTGSVNNIVVVNKSNQFIFFSDGDIISGAKQNRIFNTSVFLAPNSTNKIPVSCVEQGRWDNISDKFDSTDYTAPTTLRAEKSAQVSINLDDEVGPFSEQSKVWSKVESLACEMNVSSPSHNLSDIFKEKKKDFNAFIEMFKSGQDSNGLALFIKKRLLSIELFNRFDIYSEYFNKLLRGVALEAYHLQEDEDKLKEVEAVFKTNTFFDELDNREFQEFPGVALGKEKRFKTLDLFGFILNYDSHLIHLTALSTNKN
jgi:hypothetical protein